MRITEIVSALVAHLFIGALVLVTTLPGNETLRHRLTRKIQSPPEAGSRPGSKPAAAPTDLRFEIRARQDEDRLHISGHVTGGPPCRRMQLRLKLQPDSGQPLYHALTVADTGAGRRASFQSIRRLGPMDTDAPAQWEASVQSHECARTVDGSSLGSP